MYKKIAGAGVIILLLIAGIGAVMYFGTGVSYSGELKTFESYSQLEDFVSKGIEQAGGGRIYWSEFRGTYENFVQNDAARASMAGQDFSKTNVQVEGVDEADVVKTDGIYIYKVVNSQRMYYGEDKQENESNCVVIIKADNGTMDIVSRINVSSAISGIFIKGDRLGVICSGWEYIATLEEGKYTGPKTTLHIYNISDREKPEEVYSYAVSASYSTSRMVGDWIYMICTQSIYWIDENGTVPLPVVEENGEEREIPADEIQYIDAPQPSYSYTLISSINISGGESSEKAFILGDSSTLYASHSSIYIAVADRWSIWARGGSPPDQETEIYKFVIDGKNISYYAAGNVTGYVLNQFSMDENGEYFRVVTTKEGEWLAGNFSETQNNVYVLDKNMSIVGKIEGLAKGERIYSARFMGDKLYLVTYRQVDPLFVIDLSEPSMPEELGNLKITGASQYLHPYDENHIIGVGFEATEEGARTGVKVTLFNVSNFTSPEELSEYVIKGAWSESSWDHHAFLFSREKNIMVIPVEVWNEGGGYFSGAYVFNITLKDGIVYEGRINHEPTNMENETRYYFYENSGESYEDYVSISPGSYIDITLNCSTGKEWVIDELYDSSILKLESHTSHEAAGMKTYHYIFRAAGEGHTYIEMDLMGMSGSSIKKYGEFRLDISSYKPYWILYNYRITRSMYIDSILYTVSNSMIKSCNMQHLEEVDMLDFGVAQQPVHS